PNTNDPGGNYPQNSPNRRREWWTIVLQSQDQLRQRVAQALSEITVISERDANTLLYHYGAANWWDMLAEGAFGKYRDLLQKVTLNPMMASTSPAWQTASTTTLARWTLPSGSALMKTTPARSCSSSPSA
ncbi:MAG: DUF1800 family protein, partial [Gemmatimonas sp.]